MFRLRIISSSSSLPPPPIAIAPMPPRRLSGSPWETKRENPPAGLDTASIWMAWTMTLPAACCCGAEGSLFADLDVEGGTACCATPAGSSCSSSTYSDWHEPQVGSPWALSAGGPRALHA